MKSIVFVAMIASFFSLQAVAQQKETTAAVANDQGKVIFTSQCGKCHDADQQEAAGRHHAAGPAGDKQRPREAIGHALEK
jgi:mono/diheme cytochrome c family protein